MCICTPNKRTPICEDCPSKAYAEWQEAMENSKKASEMLKEVGFKTTYHEPKPHKCPLCDGKGEQKIDNPYKDNKYCSKCINLYLDKLDSAFWSLEGVINRISDCESCKEIVKNTQMMKPCIACKGACILWG